MLDKQTLLTLFEDTAPVIVYNLDFLPDNKLGWKPAPDAKSALEIVNHLIEYLDFFTQRLNADEAPDSFAAATNREEAKANLNEIAPRFIQAVRAASSTKLAEQFTDEMPFSFSWMFTAAVIDTIHHAGQIAYIQTMLGDNEIHFDETKMPDWAVK